MKTRNGFVSNSSTTSFMIYGAYLRKSDLHKILNVGEEDLWGVMYNKVEKAGLEYFCPPDGDGYYIGVSLNECRDDQTMGDFKKEAKAKIEVILGEVDCSVCSDGWYDG